MAAHPDALRRSTPDGRVLLVHDDVRRGTWHVEIEGVPGSEVIGTPYLVAVVAEALGYDFAQDQWPAWVDRLADEIEEEMRRKQR